MPLTQLRNKRTGWQPIFLGKKAYGGCSALLMQIWFLDAETKTTVSARPMHLWVTACAPIAIGL